MSAGTVQPDPQVVARKRGAVRWMRGFLRERPNIDPIEIVYVYREEYPASILTNADLTDCYVEARRPLTLADIPSGKGRDSLFVRRGGKYRAAVCYRDSADEVIVAVPQPYEYAHPYMLALWDILAATLPTVEETT